MRGGRSFTSRGGRPGDRDFGGKFRGSNNSYRDGGSSGGRFNNQGRGGDRRFDDNFGKGGSNRNRSRYDRRSPDRFAHNDRSSRNDLRDDSIARKRPRHDGNSGSRRDFGSNLSEGNRHNRHYSNGDVDRNSKNRNNRRSPPPKSSPSSRHVAEKNASHRPKERAPATKTVRKFGGKGAAREKAETSSRIRRSKLVSSVRSNIIRRRLVNRNREAVRRAKLMRSSLKKRDTAVKRKTTDGDDNEKADKSKTEEIDVQSGDEKESDKKKSTKKSTGDGCIEGEDKKEVESIEEKGDAIAEGDEMQVDKLSDAEDDEKKGDDKEKRKKFVRLWCMHCRIESATFKDYNNHIHSRSHKLVLGRYGLKQKTRLARMRLAQRNAQRQLEKDLKDTEKLTPQFCMLCRLNYRSPKEEHQSSEAHRKMKEFLMPYCETCSMSFKSPMSYEIHRCSVEHLRRKANKGEESDVEENEELQVNLENFLIVDSVGDVNGGEMSLNDEESDENTAEVTANKPAENSRAEINVGNEHVKKIEVLYCELCRYYLPHLEDPEAALQKHCSTRNHLRAYLRYKENQSLKITAELIHRRDHKEKHPKKDSKSVESDGKRSDSVAKTDDETTTDKVWEDTDKDCDQVEPTNIENNNEDEDEASVERYDRFKNSEKADDDDVSENDAEKDQDNKSETVEQNGAESNQ